MTTITLGGNPIHTTGALPAVGAIAPDFRLVDGELKDLTLAPPPATAMRSRSTGKSRRIWRRSS